jgi:hypothetical protein
MTEQETALLRRRALYERSIADLTEGMADGSLRAEMIEGVLWVQGQLAAVNAELARIKGRSCPA